MGYNIAVIGASGIVGGKILEVLQEEGIDIANLYLFSSARSAGKIVEYMGREYKLIELKAGNYEHLNLHFAFFAAGGEVSLKYAPEFANHNIVVIDNSSAFRLHPDVPLVVPEVNGDTALQHSNIIANPNCSTIQAAVALAPLHKKYVIKRAVFSTYQAVSGAGWGGIQDLKNGRKGLPPKHFAHPIYNNVLPHIDRFLENGYTKEEEKMVGELKKILSNDIKVTATAVRVPVENCHSQSINLQLERPCNLDDIRVLLMDSSGVTLVDDRAENSYPMPIAANNTNQVYVGRLRLDQTVESGINMWVVADNLRKGAATNAVQILKLLISRQE